VCHRSYQKRKEEEQETTSELDKKEDTQELEQMITKLKVQIEEDKRIEEALKEKLEEKDMIIGNLEAEIVTLRKEFKIKICKIAQKFWMTLSTVKNLILTRPDLDTIRQKRDQAPKQQSKKHIQKAMQKQSKGIGRYTRKITGTLLHQEDSDFRINNQQIGLKKKNDSQEHLLSEDPQLPGIKLYSLVYVMHVIILDIKL
jgi:hypothetical protein